jgi:hypothetical protein
VRPFAVIAFIAVGCYPLHFAVDPQFSANDRAEIQRAANDWNARTNSTHKITFAGDAWHVWRQEPLSGYNGYTSGSSHEIQISPEHPGATVYAVALHEFGHSIGLGHTVTGLMQAFVVDTTFTQDVLNECYRVGAC